MFRGRYEHAIDQKGRTSLPSRFRDVLLSQGDHALILTTGLDPCVVAYPVAEWQRFEERLAKLSQLDPHVAAIRRIYLSGAVDCEIDKVGRLLIPVSLRAHATLGRGAIWAGMGSHIELWAKDRFAKMCEQILGDEEKRIEVARRLSELGL